MQPKLDSLVGSIIRIVLKSGIAFNGVLKRWDSEKLVMIAVNNNEIIEILDVSQIAAIVYTPKNVPKECLEEKEDVNCKLESEPIKAEIDNTTGDKLKHPKDIKSLVELRKLSAKEDLNAIRAKLKSNTVTNTLVEYGSQFETLRGIKNNTSK